MIHRRDFLTLASASLAGSSLPSFAFEQPEEFFKISLAQWSLHRKMQSGELKNIDFPAYTKKNFGIQAVEYVSFLFEEQKPTDGYLKELRKRCDDEGIASLLIMISRAGHLGTNDKTERTEMIENHKIWMNAAAALGCHSIRVDAHGYGKTLDEQSDNCVIGLTALCEEAKQFNLNVLVENHGGPSSNGAWLAKTLSAVNLPNCGSLPDFGNFTINKESGETYDRYRGMEDLMPFAKAVSAKSYEFDAAGNETTMDYKRIIDIVVKHNYRGYIGIEYEGSKHSEHEGILKTKSLLEKIHTELQG